MQKQNWIKNAIIYQIYPMTFNYAEGSKSDPYKGAYGNLKGITEKADYIKSLGVDAVWISPFFKWNRNGFGYDITDYEKVSEMYGTAADFAELSQEFHKKGIKIITDQVFNHCSQEHEWFKKSIQKEEPYSDYFIWQDAKGTDEEGKPVPPNNWPSTWDSSGESAWTWNEKRRQFYMHSFDYTMPNLNLNNTKVQDELLRISKYWFDLGVDGFRLDGTCHYGCDPRFLDNPIIGEETTPNIPIDEIEAERGKQMRIYDVSHAKGREFIDRIEILAQSYPEPKVLLSEYVFDKGIHGNKKGRKNIRESACDTFYTGALRGDLEDFRAGVEEMTQPLTRDGKIIDAAISEAGEKMNWAMSNHDLERVASRWFGKEAKPEETKLAMKMLMALPGSVCVFQGEELGLPNANIEQARNPQNDPLALSPMVGMPWDAARTSIPWTEKGTNLWLKPTMPQRIKAVSLQEKNPDSMLHATREAIQWRKQNPILNQNGRIEFIDTPVSRAIAFIRSDESGKNKTALLFNYTDKPVKIKVPTGEKTFIPVEVPPYKMVEAKPEFTGRTQQRGRSE